MKVDASITDEMGVIYMNALILHRENPYFVEIIDAFRKVTGGYSEDKWPKRLHYRPKYLPNTKS